MSYRALLCATLAIIAVMGGMWLTFCEGQHYFPIDDAYIHLVYARNLAELGRWTFNGDDASLGTSSPLWVMLQALLFTFTDDVHGAVRALGELCLLLAMLFGALTVRGWLLQAGHDEQWACTVAVATALLFAVDGQLHWMASSGMETPLACALVGACCYCHCRRGFDWSTALIGLLCVMTRLPLIVVPLVLSCCHGRRSRPVRRRAIGLFVLGLLLLVVGRYQITGSLWPTTARGKRLTYVDGGLRRHAMPQWLLANYPLLKKLLASRLLQVERQGEETTGASFSSFLLTEWQLRERLRRLHAFTAEERKLVVLAWRYTQRWPVFWYLVACLRFQGVVPHHLVLMVLVVGAASCLGRRLRWWARLHVGVLAAAVCHGAVYAVFFRTTLHHTRYLVPAYYLVTLWAMGLLAEVKPVLGRRTLALAYVVLVAVALSVVPAWQTLYRDNVAHIARVYVPAAQWVARQTAAEARVAAFDIGILRYFGGRSVVDIGGLVDPAVHPSLARRSVAAYVKEQAATHILYSRNLDVDVFTGLYKAEFQEPWLMKQRLLRSFEQEQYEAPTLTHSFRLDLVAIEDWYPATTEGMTRKLRFDGRALTPVRPVAGQSAVGMELRGYEMDQRQVQVIPHYAYSIGLTYLYETLVPVAGRVFVHTAFFRAGEEAPAFVYSHEIGGGVLRTSELPGKRRLQERRVVFLPSHAPPAQYQVRAALTRSRVDPRERPSSFRWYELGTLDCLPARLRPIDHQQLMTTW